MKNIAIVTGANSGFGKEFVKLINEENDINEIWCFARNKEKLDLLKEEIGEKVITYSLDLSSKESIEKIDNMLSSKINEINIKYLVNNAGFGKFGNYKDIDLNTSFNMIDLNIKTVVGLCIVCSNYMNNSSHIINISSLSAFLPLPYLNIYSATKVFVRNYSRALNEELKEKGISVTAVCPGWMKTGFIDNASIGAKKSVNNFLGITSASKVAKKAFSDAKKGKSMSIYGLMTKTVHVLSKVLPKSLAIKCWLKLQKF